MGFQAVLGLRKSFYSNFIQLPNIQVFNREIFFIPHFLKELDLNFSLKGPRGVG